MYSPKTQKTHGRQTDLVWLSKDIRQVVAKYRFNWYEMYCEWKFKLRSLNASYCFLIEVVTEAGVTMYYNNHSFNNGFYLFLEIWRNKHTVWSHYPTRYLNTRWYWHEENRWSKKYSDGYQTYTGKFCFKLTQVNFVSVGVVIANYKRECLYYLSLLLLLEKSLCRLWKESLNSDGQ